MLQKLPAVAATALMCMAGAASAATINFNTYKGWSSSGHVYGPVAATGATVDTNGKILTSGQFVGSWSGAAGGLGICSSTLHSSRYCNERHTIDGGGTNEMVLLDFGAINVEINSVTFSYWDANDDYDYAIYTSSAIGTTPTLWSENNDTSGNGSPKTFSFASGAVVGSLFGFGANYSNDEFKLKSLEYTISPIPLPTSGLLLLGAIIGVAGLGRRREA